MDPIGEAIIGALILVGLFGILLPILPGLILVVGSVILWAGVTGGATPWVVAGAAIGLAATGTVVRYALPGKQLKDSGIPRSTLVIAGALAIGGFFALPIVGAPIGFVLGIYLAERSRIGSDAAGASTRRTLRAVGLSIGIELATGLLIAGMWLIAVVWLT